MRAGSGGRTEVDAVPRLLLFLALSLACQLALRLVLLLLLVDLVRLCPSAEHFAHAPPLDPLHADNARVDVDSAERRHADAAPCRADERARLGRHARPGQLGVEVRVPVALGEAVLEQDGDRGRDGGGGRRARRGARREGRRGEQDRLVDFLKRSERASDEVQEVQEQAWGARSSVSEGL